MIVRHEAVFEKIGTFVEDVRTVATEADLGAILAQISGELGFAYFALSHHADMDKSSRGGIRVHNYPAEWEHVYDEQGIGGRDPVHRACQLTAVGFAWSQLPRMMQLSSRDIRLLDAAARHGISDGFTVPAHVPGEVHGSCTFAGPHGGSVPAENLAAAQLVGAFAFEAARRLGRSGDRECSTPPHVSNRQRECLLWLGRGKSDSEIATILGISAETVHQYVKQARANYDVVSRSQLVAHALFSGTISFQDIIRK